MRQLFREIWREKENRFMRASWIDSSRDFVFCCCTYYFCSITLRTCFFVALCSGHCSSSSVHLFIVLFTYHVGLTKRDPHGTRTVLYVLAHNVMANVKCYIVTTREGIRLFSCLIFRSTTGCSYDLGQLRTPESKHF